MNIFFYLIFQKFLFNYDTIENKKKAYNWASTNAVDYSEALNRLGLNGK